MLISVCGQMWYNSITNNSFFDTTSIVIVYQWLVYYKSYITSVFYQWYITGGILPVRLQIRQSIKEKNNEKEHINDVIISIISTTNISKRQKDIQCL